ncbi:putative transmembrane protein [Cedratvirus kamchatka]|uniref:Transmembrane protein n=1 Tax=Cedratvirus kamchatka TaxID=2716914 RepID=A0A6G8MYD2_9VIRU|nr:putative transmembrane protein [Cedratvirus kamchatka]WIL04437.1 putative membrane protein [Cedratvirus lena]WIL05028.1 putative membrane protein [Cedratvirus duvanny]
MSSLAETVSLILILFGTFSISVLWIDVFQRLGEKINWSENSLTGSFYLAAITTILFIIVILTLEYYDVNIRVYLGDQGL